MRIAVHAKMLSEAQLNGMGYYTFNLLKALASIDAKNEYDLYSDATIIHRVEAKNFRERVLPFPKFWTYLRLPLELVKDPHDIVFVPHEKLPPFARGRKVITAYDLHSLKDYMASPISLTAKIHFLIAIKRVFKKADRILAISEATKRSVVDIAGVDPAKVVVTPLGYDAALYRPCSETDKARVRKKYAIERPFIINTSSLLWYRKNIPRAIEAYAKSSARKDFSLVITGKRGESYDEVIKEIQRHSLEKNVFLLGYVPTDDMPLLLGAASALVFPSLHEGFGLPIVEAFACGCPVITSNVSAMPEVAGDAALLVDPKDIVAISSAIDRLLGNGALVQALREKGLERAKSFSWERTARETLKVFEALA